MKHPQQNIDKACTDNIWIGKKSDLEKLVKDAIMYSFQNTTEDFNMESIQGLDYMTNDVIYKRLTE